MGTGSDYRGGSRQSHSRYSGQSATSALSQFAGRRFDRSIYSEQSQRSRASGFQFRGDYSQRRPPVPQWENNEARDNLQVSDSVMPVKRKATAAQKGKTVAGKRIEREPPAEVEEGESHNETPPQTFHAPPVSAEQRGVPAPAPAPPVPPPAAPGHQMAEAIQLLTQLVAAQAQRQDVDPGDRAAHAQNLEEQYQLRRGERYPERSSRKRGRSFGARSEYRGGQAHEQSGYLGQSVASAPPRFADRGFDRSAYSGPDQ
ncbi:serine/threonine-protein kinase STE20-like, partial [Lycium ferocissimum]|uniref:serine/threonine-protein kinase STE20-like n=1 Tax=Lycium ferocissimum TaxID=112874 RepID=UPI0028163890